MINMNFRFDTASGITCIRSTCSLDYKQGIRDIVETLDHEHGMFLSSGIDYPRRYSRWEIGFTRSPLELIAKDRELRLNALNKRGAVLIELFFNVLTADPAVEVKSRDAYHLVLEIAESRETFTEEERSLQPSVFTPLRSLFQDFRGIDDALIGCYGAFGYDLVFQFEQIERVHHRSPQSKDMHLFLPDSIFSLDRRKETLNRFDYLFQKDDQTTEGIDNTPFKLLVAPKADTSHISSDVTSPHSRDEFEDMVEAARGRMQVGDVYELVLHRRFTVNGAFVPSAVWNEMTAFNPSPYEFLCQFGSEQLIGTSPEMYICVTGDRVESCPISGTVRSGENAMEDAKAIRNLINSEKDEVELTMCTDVDRNDKARICVPGTVKLLDRRVIERYAGLFHTVDHVEGRLRPGFTGIDAFLSHMWAVTLTGSPKPMAVRLIEKMENEPRGWYGGAVGALMFNGDVSTGITIRTIHLTGDSAHYRVGATLVYDSKGLEEEMETQTKAAVFFRTIEELKNKSSSVSSDVQQDVPGEGLSVLLIDNEDSFVNILADYFRQTGAMVKTYRHGLPLDRIQKIAPDLVVHSPGPGRPRDFGVPNLVRAIASYSIPQFGVCLGLQGIAEAFGGSLLLLEKPRQGKRWTITHEGVGIFSGLPSPCEVGAYHALYADDKTMPDCLEILSRNEIGITMALRHRELPINAVQFHPESILSMQESIGYRLIANLMKQLRNWLRS